MPMTKLSLGLRKDATDHNVDEYRDGYARLDVLGLLVEVLAEGTNIHSPLKTMNTMVQIGPDKATVSHASRYMTRNRISQSRI